jgi:hypothetical protein
MRRSTLTAVVVAALLSLVAATPSAEAARAKHYKTCKAMGKDYPHGVGRKGARDHTSGKRVRNFVRNNKLYSYNDGKGANPPREYDLDRDNDGIACERL